MKISIYTLFFALFFIDCSSPEVEEDIMQIKKRNVFVEDETFFDFLDFTDVLSKVVCHDADDNLIYFFHRSTMEKTEVVVFNYEEKTYYQKSVDRNWVLFGNELLNSQYNELYIQYNKSLKVYDAQTFDLKDEILLNDISGKFSANRFSNFYLIGRDNTLGVYNKDDHLEINESYGGPSRIHVFEEHDTIYTFSGVIGGPPILTKMGKNGQIFSKKSFPPNNKVDRNIYTNENVNFVIGENIVYSKWDLEPLDTLTVPSLNHIAISEDGKYIYAISELKVLFKYSSIDFKEIEKIQLPSVPRYIFTDEGKIIIIYQEGARENKVKIGIL